MTDDRIRNLERRWRETGALEDEVSYILERLRSGGLTKNQLGLAAYCGHPAARLALDFEPASDEPQDVEGWVSGIQAFEPDRATCARLELGIAWACLPLFEARYPAVKGPRRSLEAFEDWVLAPSESNRARALQNPTPARVDLFAAEEFGDLASTAYMVTTQSPILNEEEDPAGYLETVVIHARLSQLPLERIKAAIASEVTPWLLGYHDPAANRAGAR